MGSRSRQKGKRGELELARFLTAEGFDARRGQQYSGIEGKDVVCRSLPLHIETKRVEALRLYPSLQQAIDDAPEGEIPMVAHRRNHQEWVAILRLEDLLAILRESELVEVRE